MGNKSNKKRTRQAAKFTQRHHNEAKKDKPVNRDPPKRRRSERVKASAESRKRCFEAQAGHILNPPGYDPRKYTVDVWEPDLINCDDPLQCVDYVSDIYQRLFQSELTYYPSSHLQKDSLITEQNRAVIVDWLVHVHNRHHSDAPTSLHLAVNILDRYVASDESIVADDNLQLVAATSLFIASKFEDIYPVTCKFLVTAARKNFTKDDVLDLECEILSTLRFKIMVPTGIPFLNRFLHLTKATSLMKEAAEYYLERLLLEHSSLREPPSLLAAACVCLAINHPQIHVMEEIPDDRQGIPTILCEYTGYSSVKIRRVATYVAETVASRRLVPNATRSPSQQLNAVGRKHKISRLIDGPDARDIAA